MNGAPPEPPTVDDPADERYVNRLPCSVVDLLQPGHVTAHMERQAQPVEAIPTPLRTWDQNCRDEGGGQGLAKGWHVVVAGNTGTGKSLMALNCGATALRSGRSVCYVNLEMSRGQIATRLYSILTGEPVRGLEPGETFDPKVAQRAAERVAEVAGGVGFFVNERPLQKVDSILGFMGYVRENKGCEFFVLDYMQLVRSNYETMIREITDVSMAVSGFAKRFKVVTLGLSQLNRESSKNYQVPPSPQSLMGGSPLENDADQVLLLDHSTYERKKTYDRVLANTRLLLAKNRHGSAAKIPVQWDYSDLTVREREGTRVE